MIEVAVNLLWCRPGEVGGSEEYLARQLAGLIELYDDGEIVDVAPTLYALPTWAAAHSDLAARLPVEAAPIDGASRPRRVLAESGWLARRTRGAALVHHGGGTVPAVHPGRIVLTLHDLQFLTYPENFSTVKRAFLERAVPASVRRADVVAVPSEYVAATVRDAFGESGAQVVVVPHGLARPVGEATPPAVLRERYGLPGAVIVYPAITHPHKGHVTLVRAFAALRGDHPDARLVLLGGAGRAADVVTAEIERLGLGAAVVRPGRVPDVDRDGLLALARVLAFPSRYEGFGAPVLEAMAVGCPVVAADATALSEVVGEAGLLVEPGDVDAWAEAIGQVLADDQLAADLAADGRARAALFTARRSARALVRAYRQALL
jgi:alpha-1,3-rhamnosyl/mannosyltransferase